MKKVKLLRITTETYSLNILLKGQLRYMGERGIEVSMASSPDENVEFLKEQQNANFYPLPLTRELTPIKDLISLFHTIRLIRKIKPDIVHTHSPKAGIVGMLAAFICRVPVRIHTVAGLPLMEVTGFKRKLLDKVESLTYWCADWVLPNSNELKTFILDNNLSDTQEKVKVIGNGSSNGLDMKYFSTTPEMIELGNHFKKENGITSKSVVLAFMGRLANYKGVNELVEAFVKLQQMHKNLVLLLIGGFEELNPLKDSVKREIATNDSIISVGHQKDVRMFLSIANLFVFPSYREGFPQALMQACAMGLPSIASDINGCNELIKEGVNGKLIPTKDVQAIVTACSELIQNPDLRNQMGIASQQFVIQNFEQNALWNKIHKFYEDSLIKE